MIYLAVALAGALGAVCRFLMDTLVRSQNESYFPWGTFVVNISGSFALGIIAALALRFDIPEVFTIAASTGFLGAYTTFSGWMVQTIELIESGAWNYALHNVFSSVVLGILAAAGGFALIAWATS
ncbi:MAG: fluoride efflux transporter CrcB [Balneolales bacterium]